MLHYNLYRRIPIELLEISVDHVTNFLLYFSHPALLNLFDSPWSFTMLDHCSLWSLKFNTLSEIKLEMPTYWFLWNLSSFRNLCKVFVPAQWQIVCIYSGTWFLNQEPGNHLQSFSAGSFLHAHKDWMQRGWLLHPCVLLLQKKLLFHSDNPYNAQHELIEPVSLSWWTETVFLCTN